MYLEKTAEAISSLQEMHIKNNSLQSPSKSICKGPRNNQDNSANFRSTRHKRNASVDAATNNKHEFYDSSELFSAQEMKHVNQNSYEGKRIQPASSKCSGIDQTISCHSSIENHSLHKNSSDVDKKTDYRENNDTLSVSNDSPIRRSSSFCNRNIANILPTKASTPKANKRQMNRPITGNNSLQKSSSSSSFKKLTTTTPFYEHYQTVENEFLIINGDDNLRTTCDEILFSSDESHVLNSPTGEEDKHQTDRQKSEPPISHTRYNKAFLMRLEQNRQTNNDNKGAQACPNTPELSRRAVNPRFRDPISMPRDSSLSRMKQGLPNIQTTKKVLTQVTSKDSSSSSTCSSKQRVLPKYMDISKYKPVQGQTFLKRDESKSTLISRNEIRKSPSATGLSKHDRLRSSGRIKSAGAKPSTPSLKGR